MEVKPLGESPEVIHLFESMEQNRLYVEKSQMEEIVAHMDELLTSIKQIEKELADMRSLTGNAFTSIVDEGSTAVAEAKSVVQRAKYKIRDISGRAAALGGNALISALQLVRPMESRSMRLWWQRSSCRNPGAGWTMWAAMLCSAPREWACRWVRRSVWRNP